MNHTHDHIWRVPLPGDTLAPPIAIQDTAGEHAPVDLGIALADHIRNYISRCFDAVAMLGGTASFKKDGSIEFSRFSAEDTETFANVLMSELMEYAARGWLHDYPTDEDDDLLGVFGCRWLDGFDEDVCDNCREEIEASLQHPHELADPISN